MAEEKLLTVRDVAIILDISEKEVIDLAEDGKIPAYKVGGIYLRFKKSQVYEYREALKKTHPRKSEHVKKYLLKDRIADFIYFNDFFIISTLVIIVMLFFIFRG